MIMMVMVMVMVMIVMVGQGPVIMMVIMMVIVIMIMMVPGFSGFSGFPEGHRFGGLSTATGVTHVALPRFSENVQSTLMQRTLSSLPCRISTNPWLQAGQTAMK